MMHRAASFGRIIDDLGLTSVLQHASYCFITGTRGVAGCYLRCRRDRLQRRTISMTKAPQPKTLEAQLTGPAGT